MKRLLSLARKLIAPFNIASRDPSATSTLELEPEEILSVDTLEAEINELQNELEEAQKDHENTIAELDTVQAQKTLTEELDEASKVRKVVL